MRKSGVFRVCGEKVAAARTEKLGTHTNTHRTTAIPPLLAYGSEGNKKINKIHYMYMYAVFTCYASSLYLKIKKVKQY